MPSDLETCEAYRSAYEQRHSYGSHIVTVTRGFSKSADVRKRRQTCKPPGLQVWTGGAN
jgi:hypothetical protein